jgi:hypothetical protein
MSKKRTFMQLIEQTLKEIAELKARRKDELRGK